LPPNFAKRPYILALSQRIFNQKMRLPDIEQPRNGYDSPPQHVRKDPEFIIGELGKRSYITSRRDEENQAELSTLRII
jgi:hypothetical protein